MVLAAKLHGITLVQFRALVELSMALGRGIGSQPANSSQPGFARSQHMFEVRRMRTVDHVVRGRAAGSRIHPFYGVVEWFGGWQLSICFDCERDHDWHFKRSRRAHDPDRLF